MSGREKNAMRDDGKRTLMVLGASYSQVPLLRAAKRLGCHTVAVSIPGDYAGLKEADEVVYADITDPEAVLKAARDKKIDGITTCCMDLGIQAQGYVCEKMGLPGPTYFGASAACDKSLEKQAYVKAGVSTAPFAIVHNQEELAGALEKLHLPVMIKAVDQTGSKGIYRADTPEEAAEMFNESMAWTNKDFCVVEECIEGTMFGVEAMISRGEPAYVLPLGNVRRDGNPAFPIGHFVPWEQGEALRGQITEQVRRVAQALQFDDCAMDLDCMLRDGQIYIIEATARAGATCITDTVSLTYGIDYFEAIVKAALGEDVRDMFRGDGAGAYPASLTRLLSSDREGRVSRIVTPETLPPEVKELSFNIAPGDQVRPMRNGRDRIGQLIIAADTLEQCYQTQAQVLQGIRVETE